MMTSAGMFLLLVFFSTVLFTKGAPNTGQRKLQHNRFYRLCGYGILTRILLIVIYFRLPDDRFLALHNAHPVFYLETLALIIFSISWLTKEEMILGISDMTY